MLKTVKFLRPVVLSVEKLNMLKLLRYEIKVLSDCAFMSLKIVRERKVSE